MASRFSVTRVEGFLDRLSIPHAHPLNRIPLLNPIHDIHSVDDMAEGGVSRVEVRLWRVRDEELAAARVLPRQRHSDGAAKEGTLVQLVADRVAGSALAIASRVSILHDEVRDHAMDLQPVEKPFAGKRDETP